MIGKEYSLDIQEFGTTIANTPVRLVSSMHNNQEGIAKSERPDKLDKQSLTNDLSELLSVIAVLVYLRRLS